MAVGKKSGLGRGLDSLFQTVEIEHTTDNNPKDSDYIRVDINDIKPNSGQPRKTFDEEKLNELAASIIENGLIQPIVVRKLEKGYEIVAGERRWRAARKANLKEVPCIVRELSDEQNMIFAIIENMQREDLNPIEEAEGLENMIKSFGLTQEEISKAVGKSRPYITNALRLLNLNGQVREFVLVGKLSAAHGRTLLAIDDEKEQLSVAIKAVKEGLSVRKLEELVSGKKTVRRGKPAKRSPKGAEVVLLERELAQLLGTKVNINGNNKKGIIEIEYYGIEDLNRLLELIG